MSIAITRRTRSLLSRSLPLVNQRKYLLVEHMDAILDELAGDRAFPTGELAGGMLTELLIAQTRALVENGAFGPLDRVAGEHCLAGITGRHYSRFGDALVPVLRDLLGPTSPREVAAAWSDTFWALIHAVRDRSAAEATPVAVAARA